MFPMRQPLMRGQSAVKRMGLAMLPVVTIAVILAVATVPGSAISQMTGELELGLNAQKAGNLKEAIEIYSEVIRTLVPRKPTTGVESRTRTLDRPTKRWQTSTRHWKRLRIMPTLSTIAERSFANRISCLKL